MSIRLHRLHGDGPKEVCTSFQLSHGESPPTEIVEGDEDKDGDLRAFVSTDWIGIGKKWKDSGYTSSRMLSTEALVKLRTRHQTPFTVKAIRQTHHTHVVTEVKATADNSNGTQPKQLTLRQQLEHCMKAFLKDGDTELTTGSTTGANRQVQYTGMFRVHAQSDTRQRYKITVRLAVASVHCATFNALSLFRL